MTRRAAPEPKSTARAARRGLKVREITDPGDTVVASAYALLRQTFPPGERVRLSEWRASLGERAGGVLSDIAWHLLVVEDKGEVLGLASGTYVGSVNVGVVGYLAIASSARSHGLGSRLRSRLRRLFEFDAQRLSGKPLAGVIGEVSAENPWISTLARRPNVVLLDFPYHQPTLHPGDVPTPFVLYYESIGRVRQRLPVTEFKRILFAIWRRVYRVSRPLAQPAFRAMMRSLEGRRWVGRTRSFPRARP